MVSGSIIDWLLEPDSPSLRHRTLVELLGRPADDPEVMESREGIAGSADVKAIMGKMHPDGYWLQRDPRTGRVYGDGVQYGSFASTHFCLAYLAELGMDRSDPRVAKAAERYLSLQKEDGDFFMHFSCLLGLNIRTFAMLGYKDDPRVRRSVDLLLKTERPDGGYLCDIHEGKRKTRPVKSCIRGSAKALLAFSCLPELWGHERVLGLARHFLARGGIYKTRHPGEHVNKDMGRISFPITWRANAFEILLALGRMGHGRDGRLARAWAELDARADRSGRYPLDWTPAQSPWKVGERGAANKWVTFYACLAHRLRGE